MRLTAQERETIVNLNQEEAIAYIYTCDPKWWRHFERLGVQPTAVHKDSAKQVYALEYEVPKRWVKAPKPPKKVVLTEEQKAALVERLRPRARIK